MGAISRLFGWDDGAHRKNARSRSLGSLDYHEICFAFPEMNQAQFRALRDDIAVNGMRESVWLFEDKVIDGRHRLRAAEELGLDVNYQIFAGTEVEAIAFAISANSSRRHLSTPQRAISIAKLARNYADAQRLAVIAACSKRTMEDAIVIIRSGDEDVIRLVVEGKVSITRGHAVVTGRLKREFIHADGRKRSKAMQLVETAAG